MEEITANQQADGNVKRESQDTAEKADSEDQVRHLTTHITSRS